MKKNVVVTEKSREGGKRKKKGKMLRMKKTSELGRQTFSFILIQYRIRQFFFGTYLPTFYLHYLNQCNL